MLPGSYAARKEGTKLAWLNCVCTFYMEMYVAPFHQFIKITGIPVGGITRTERTV
jgi:hypothetical protein